jgi:hypothetical protein
MEEAMKPAQLRSLPLLITALALSAPAWAGASVMFTDPDRYTDMPFAQWDRADVLKQVEEHFAKLAKSLPPGQDLKVEVTDIDLAGNVDYARGAARDLRVLRGTADWPRMQLKFSVESGGKTVKSGEASVSDMNYLRNMNRYPNNEPLRYEKRMLDQWFEKEILGRAKS